MTDTAKPTLDDVARAAGVSTATVSRCLNSPDQVIAPTRIRVMQAVEALGYTPDFGGRALASRRTNTVGAIIPTMDNAIFARGLQSFQGCGWSRFGKTLLVASYKLRPARERERWRVAGRDAARRAVADRLGSARKQHRVSAPTRGIPFVGRLDNLGGDATAISSACDNRAAAARLFGRCGISTHGHPRLAMIAASRSMNDPAADRTERRAFGSRGGRNRRADLPGGWRAA